MGLLAERAFTKNGSTADDDFTIPGAVVPDSRKISLYWEVGAETDLVNITSQKLMIGVTFRDADGAEMSGTCSMDVVLEYPAKVSAPANQSSALSSWKLIGTRSGFNVKEAQKLDVGGVGVAAIRLYGITGDPVTTTVTIQHWIS